MIDVMLPAVNMKGVAMTKECRSSLEARKVRKWIFFPEPPEKMHPCQHLDFILVRCVIDFQTTEM